MHTLVPGARFDPDINTGTVLLIILLADGQIKKVGSKEEVIPELLGAGAHCKTLTDKL